MATEARKLRVGLFVIGGVLIGAAAAIWLGASRFFTDEVLAVTYVAESVQGLDAGASVKYRGVPAGRVERIAIAPDGDLIEVTMSLQSEYGELLLKDPTMRATLQLSGITGLRYIEINRYSGDALQSAPELTFEPELPLIASTPSQFRAIQEALEDIYDKVMSVDLAGVAADARATLQAADELLRDSRVQQIVTNLSATTDSMARVTHNVEQATENVRLEPVVTDLRQTTAEAKALLADLRDGETGEGVRRTLREVDGLARTTQSFVLDLQVMIDRLNRTSENLELLTNELRQQPSRLLFSNPPPPRRSGDD